MLKTNIIVKGIVLLWSSQRGYITTLPKVHNIRKPDLQLFESYSLSSCWLGNQYSILPSILPSRNIAVIKWFILTLQECSLNQQMWIVQPTPTSYLICARSPLPTPPPDGEWVFIDVYRDVYTGVVSTMVGDSPCKIFVGAVPNYLSEDQVLHSTPLIHLSIAFYSFMYIAWAY